MNEEEGVKMNEIEEERRRLILLITEEVHESLLHIVCDAMELIEKRENDYRMSNEMFIIEDNKLVLNTHTDWSTILPDLKVLMLKHFRM